MGLHMKRPMGLWACLALVPATLVGQTPPLWDGAEWERRCREGEGADEGLRRRVMLIAKGL